MRQPKAVPQSSPARPTTAPARSAPPSPGPGKGADKTIISGGNANRIFSIVTGGDVLISGVTLRDGYTDGNGGAILSAAGLTLSSTQVISNRADLEGGGMYGAALTLIDAVLSQNSAGGNGGGP